MSTQNLLVKVLIWRVVSIMLTLLTTYLYTGDIKEASGVTMILHAVLIVGHYLFEYFWIRFENQNQDPEE